MEAFALFAFPFLMAAGAHEAMLAQQRYVAAQEGQHYVYAMPPGYGWAPGAAIGAGVGALAGGGGPALAGALIGGTIGHAATTPVYVAPAAYAPPAHAPAPSRASAASSASTEAFIANWMGFMQPSARR